MAHFPSECPCLIWSSFSPVQPSGAGIAKFGMLDSASADGCRKFTLDLRQAPALIPSRDTYAVFTHLRIRPLVPFHAQRCPQTSLGAVFDPGPCGGETNETP